MIAEFAEGGGDFFVAGQTQQVNHDVAKCGQILWPVTLFDLAFVFAKGHVANPMQTVFDAPVTAPVFQEKGRIRQFAGKAGDGVLDFDRRVAMTLGRAFETENLS